MPTYRYLCSRDGEFEQWRSIHVDSSLADCPSCGIGAPKVMVVPQLSPRIHDRYLRPQGPPAGNHNSWEKGRVTDHRGVPLVDRSADGIPVKDFAANRSRYEERLRVLDTHPDPFGVKTGQG